MSVPSQPFAGGSSALPRWRTVANSRAKGCGAPLAGRGPPAPAATGAEVDRSKGPLRHLSNRQA